MLKNINLLQNLLSYFSLTKAILPLCGNICFSRVGKILRMICFVGIADLINTEPWKVRTYLESLIFMSDSPICPWNGCLSNRKKKLQHIYFFHFFQHLHLTVIWLTQHARRRSQHAPFPAKLDNLQFVSRPLWTVHCSLSSHHHLQQQQRIRKGRCHKNQRTVKLTNLCAV